MKRIFTILLSALVSIALLAQAPNMMDFQSLVRDASGNFVSNKTIGVQISILKTSATGTVVYCETHSVTTNANGLLTLTIGKGTVKAGTFASIDWSAGPYFLKTEMDVNGGTSYTLTQTTQMMSVPYALYANKAGNVPDVSALEARLAALEAKESIGGSNAGNVKIENGAIKAAFSVSATKKVYFSQGNLQYQASTKTWRFALHQYDIIGKNNKNYSTTYNGWIDLFAWSTSSKNDYGVIKGNNDCTTFTGSFVDWGKNKISNGGNVANTWHTLSNAEWKYLLLTRANASQLYFRAKVAGCGGWVILPDNFYQVSGASYISTAFTIPEDYYAPNKPTEIYAAQWPLYESFGAVFLPEAGLLSGTSYSAPQEGYYFFYYWTATSSGTYDAYRAYLNAHTKAYEPTADYRCAGYAVRLVQTVK